MAINSHTNKSIQVKKPIRRDSSLTRQPLCFRTSSQAKHTAKMEANVPKHDYYAILGLRKKTKSTEQEIQCAYRRLALVHHPDKAKCPTSKDKFLLIQEAHATLRDESRRSIYNVQWELHFGCHSRTANSPLSSTAASELTPREFEKEVAYTRSKIMEMARKIRVMEKGVENLDRQRRVAERFRSMSLEQVSVEIKGLREDIRKMGALREKYEDREDELMASCTEVEDRDVEF